MVNGLRKITWASIFHLKRHICKNKYNYKDKYKYIYKYTYMKNMTTVTENGSFRLFAANEKWNFVFLVR
jgi:hypothetical protein